jgi:hypothetical protein
MAQGGRPIHGKGEAGFYTASPFFISIQLFLLQLNRSSLRIYLGFGDIESVQDDLQDGPDSEHYRDAYDPPDHMALAIRLFFLICLIDDKLENSPKEKYYGQGKEKINKRIYDHRIYLSDQSIESLP